MYSSKYHKETPSSLSQAIKNVMYFFTTLFCKIGEQEGRTGLARGGGMAPLEW
jgi:hypothetical protein